RIRVEWAAARSGQAVHGRVVPVAQRIRRQQGRTTARARLRGRAAPVRSGNVVRGVIGHLARLTGSSVIPGSVRVEELASSARPRRGKLGSLWANVFRASRPGRTGPMAYRRN